MDVPKTYSAKETEPKWYKAWMAHGLFKSQPDEREPFTIVIPPPNVTGVLHMGHMLNNTLQDVLVRQARMRGLNACWVPGTDHASIATEAKVVEKLRKEGIDKNDISRDEFLEHAWEWTNRHGGIILKQLRQLGASCDWDRTRFTMEPALSDAVTKSFVALYEKGYIYKGVRMINWDPAALTALSDEEVVFEEVNSKLYYVRYKIEGGEDEWIQVATTRPETILGDTAICVHPDDKRYSRLRGKHAVVPLVNRIVPIIQDEYVDMEFGTGALKITPAHDMHDYEIGIKHRLEVIDILNDDGTLNEKAGFYINEERFATREKIEKDLREQGHLVKVEDLLNKVGRSERTGAVIEPRLSMQWFCRMEELARPALENVMNGNIRFHPDKFKKSYRHWMENIKDWCISRQLWWGHRIPVWYCDGQECRDVLIVRETPPEECPNCHCKDRLRQDEDVLDTWFSSWLWPISVFDGFDKKDDIRYYYPTSNLVTAPEIIFFWVARMIMAGYEFMGEKPFSNVYFTGIVRDKLGRKMSKSLGNSPEPLDLISQYGADGVRVGMLLCSPAGNDLLFKTALCEQGRNFCNKLWNAFRLISIYTPDKDMEQPEASKLAIKWFNAKMQESLGEIEKLFSEFRISEVLMACYRLVWDEFCSWYLEIVKPKPAPGHKGSIQMDCKTHEATVDIFETLLKLLHPFMPFITEEIWHRIRERKEGDFIMIAPWPEKKEFDTDIIESFEYSKEVIANIRTFRTENGISPKEELDLFILEHKKHSRECDKIMAKLCSLCRVDYINEKMKDTYSFIVGANEYYLPYRKDMDVSARLEKLRDDLKYTQGFYNSVKKKLDNSSFVQNAPSAVVEKERRKSEDALTRIRIIKEQIAMIEKS